MTKSHFLTVPYTIKSMTKQDLVRYLHQYTPWELLHMKNMEEIQDLERLNQSLDNPLTKEDKAYGLHLPTNPKPPFDTLGHENFFSESDPRDIKIIQHDRYTPPRLHNHDFYEMFYVYEGEFMQVIEGQKFLMRTGDICIIPPYVYHSLDVHNYSIVINILVTRSRFENMIISELSGSNVFSSELMPNVYTENVNNYLIFHTNGDVEIQDIVLRMCMEALTERELDIYFLNAYLLLLLGRLLRDFSASCDRPSVTKKRYGQNFEILRYMDMNYKDVTLTDISDHFNYSAQHMSKLIKMITGMSFQSYVLTKRMEAAAHLLSTTNMKIKDIGPEVGYFNQENFVRSFNKFYSLTPTAYRAKHKKQPEVLTADMA